MQLDKFQIPQLEKYIFLINLLVETSWNDIFVQESEAELILNKGFIITADSEIYVLTDLLAQVIIKQAQSLVKEFLLLELGLEQECYKTTDSTHLGL